MSLVHGISCSVPKAAELSPITFSFSNCAIERKSISPSAIQTDLICCFFFSHFRIPKLRKNVSPVSNPIGAVVFRFCSEIALPCSVIRFAFQSNFGRIRGNCSAKNCGQNGIILPVEDSTLVREWYGKCGSAIPASALSGSIPLFLRYSAASPEIGFADFSNFRISLGGGYCNTSRSGFGFVGVDSISRRALS